MKRRKWISLLLCGALILATLPTTALAEETETEADAGVQVESVSEEVPVEENIEVEEAVVTESVEENGEENPEETLAEASETNPEPDSEEIPEEIVEIKDEETVKKVLEEEFPEENPENTIEEVPAETEQESIPAEEENPNSEETVVALAANNEPTTLKSPGIAVQAGTTSVSYYDENGAEQTKVCNDVITQSNIGNYGTLTEGWYAVEGNVTGDTRIEIQGAVNLILKDGCSFTVNGGIEVSGITELLIWGQQKGNGKLNVQNVAEYCAGIGGGKQRAGGRIVINGGEIEAIGGNWAAGIGGGYYGNGGNITINRGIVRSEGYGGAGIGGGFGSFGDKIFIHGGEIHATGKSEQNGNVSGSGAGIGGGHAGDGGQITITGGRIEAKGEVFAAGIGGGHAGPGGNIKIQGGIVTASTLTNADELFAIGSGKDMSGGSVSITNGFVTTTGKIDPSGKAGWSGIIFENSEKDGIVYGNLTLSQAFTLETTQNLLIPENASLQGTDHFTNNGNVYVDDTLVESVSGNVSYLISVTGGTAEGSSVSIYNNQTYGKPDGTITLNGTNIPEGQIIGEWTCSDSAVTVTNNTFTMPTKALTFKPNYLLIVTYWEPVNQKNETAGCNAILKTDNISQYTTLPTGWYAIEGTVTGKTRIEIEGNVNLILKDGCSFNVNGGIEVNKGNALTIWGQQEGNGKLNAQNVEEYCAGIGGHFKNGGNITVAGGSIIATGGNFGAGIGGGAGGTGGNIVVIGGSIKATGGNFGAGIGGGDNGEGGIIRITGGKIESEGGDSGAGIGGGDRGSGGDIQIRGGIVYAISNLGNTDEEDEEFSIGAGRCGKGGKLSITNSVVMVKRKINKSSKDTWSGIIFERSKTDGIVYGNPILSQEFTLEDTQKLLIPESTSLQGTLKNDGNIYVSGTFAESVSGSGNVHYALTVIGGTAQGDISTYNNQLYGKTGGSITLNATNVPAGQATVWTCSDDTVTVTNNTFTMPAKALTFTPNYLSAVTYWDPVNQKNETAGCNAILKADNISQYTTLPTGWYAVEGTVTGDTRIEVQGTVNLILEDGCSFTVNGGIGVNAGNALTIWGQQKGNGKLKAQNVVKYCAGIGGGNNISGGNITINGGIIQSEGRLRGAGIGGGGSGAGGIITINNGEIQSKGGHGGAGIGGGGSGAGGTITINAGKIQSEGGYSGAGIGGGVNAAGGTITMNGGEITASGETKENRQSGKAAGIGGGFGSKGLGGTILITCGTIRAKGGETAAGIGSGNAAAGTGNIHIQGGIIYASTNIADGQNESFFERLYAIGGGSGRTDGSITITNGVVITKGKINKSNKDTWSGMIFENTETDGIVYGDPTLSQKFTLEDTQNLLIPENTSLQGTANLTNDGNIYVSGTLAESVSGSGKVHYALTVTGGTAGGDVSTYKNQLYGKTGGSVTLNATNVPVGQAASWSCSDDTVTITNDTFTMPAKKLTVTAQYTNAPTYTVTIPATVELGDTAEIQAEDVNVVSGSQLVVRLSNANGLKLTTPEGAEQLYTIKNGGTSIKESDAVLTVAGGTADNRGTVSLDFAPDGETKYAGVYTGTVMFNVSVEAASNP